ncbi:hypothetical protein CEXT_325501 [Caerostris extrusa]|uniref:Uncharacterized protein n=1 Tax=Caerostris extrusa TaxID=172846 RepID=A0AAV4V127_CAEEX|nr:hypothetical protein CEXT_325501 [Caerostris extrusa]
MGQMMRKLEQSSYSFSGKRHEIMGREGLQAIPLPETGRKRLFGFLQMRRVSCKWHVTQKMLSTHLCQWKRVFRSGIECSNIHVILRARRSKRKCFSFLPFKEESKALQGFAKSAQYYDVYRICDVKRNFVYLNKGPKSS